MSIDSGVSSDPRLTACPGIWRYEFIALIGKKTVEEILKGLYPAPGDEVTAALT